jgi:hypothetical protein
MILPFSYLANWRHLRQLRQHATDVTTARENRSRVSHTYKVGDRVLVTSTYLQGKLQRPTQEPYAVVNTTKQNINGTIVVRRDDNSVECLNIRLLLPFCPVEDANAVT